MNDQYNKALSWQMFNRISPRYDILNRLLSFGIDRIWRQSLVDLIPEKKGSFYLDLATGTGDVLLEAAKRKSFSFDQMVGMDLADHMMMVGEQKLTKHDFFCPVRFVRGDATQIDLPSNSVDVVTMAFGIRNVSDPKLALNSIHDVLRSKGMVLIMEFSIPSFWLLKMGYLFYFRYLLPFFGRLISGDKEAYSYLNKTVEDFPYGDSFCELMRDSGFKSVKQYSLSGGIAMIYQGVKS